MAKTLYRGGKPYKYISDTGKVSRVSSDPLEKSKKSSPEKQYVTQTVGVEWDGTQTYTVKDDKGKVISQEVTKPVKKSSSSSKITTQKVVYAERTPVTGGVTEYSVNGQWTTKKPVQVKQAAQTPLQKAFSNSNLNFLSKTYNERQLNAVYNRLQKQDTGRISNQLWAIERNKNLNIPQKEQAKAKVLGLEKKDFISGIKTINTLKASRVKDMIKLTDSEVLARKVLNGESMTPTQQQQVVKNVNANAQNIKKWQIEQFKNLPKNVGLGVWEVGKETYIFGRDIVKGSYNYGFNASKRANEKGESVLITIGKDIKDGTKAVFKGGKELTKFVVNNPKTAATIVGVAVASGLKSSEKSFTTNPVKSLTKAVLYLSPSTAIKGVKVVSKVPLKYTKNLTNVVNTKYNIANKIRTLLPSDIKINKISYITKNNLVSGSSKTDLIISTIDSKGTSIKGIGTLRYKPKDKTIVGNIKIKDRIIKINLKDKGDYYFDTKLKLKVPKKEIEIKNIKNIKIKEYKTKESKREATLKKDFEFMRTTTEKKTSKFRGTPTSAGQKIKKSIYAEDYEKIKGIERKEKGVIFRDNLGKQIKFNLSEKNKLLDRIKININKGYSIVTEGYSISEAEEKYITLLGKYTKKVKNITKNKIINLSTNNKNFIKPLIKSKKAQLNVSPKLLFEDKKIPIKKKAEYIKKVKLGNTIYVPELKGYIYFPKKLRFGIKGLNRLLKTVVLSKYKLDTKVSTKLNTKTITPRISQVQKPKQKVKTKQVQKPIQKKVVKQVQKPIQKSASASITKQVTEQITKPVSIKGGKIPTIKVVTPPVIPKIPKLKLSFDKLKPNQIANFEGVYRERRNRSKAYNPKTNPRVIKKIQLTTTKNRLLNQLSKQVDNSAVRSMQIKLIGTTNKIKKDVSQTSTLKKFRLKKGKNPKVLTLVEKNKNTLDTKGEKKELKFIKSIKPKKKAQSKTISSKLKVPKLKKSSNIKRSKVSQKVSIKNKKKVSKLINKPKKTSKRTKK